MVDDEDIHRALAFDHAKPCLSFQRVQEGWRGQRRFRIRIDRLRTFRCAQELDIEIVPAAKPRLILYG